MEKIRLKNGVEFALNGNITPHSIPIDRGGVPAGEIIAQMNENNLSEIRLMTENGKVTGVYMNQLMRGYSVSGEIVTVSIDDEDLVRLGLTLDEDGRIVSVTEKRYAPNGAVIVDSLPDGNPADYLYVNGEYIYDPLPVPEPGEPQPTQEERITALEQRLDEYELAYAEGVQDA